MEINRRTMLSGTAAGAASLAMMRGRVMGAEGDPMRIVDTNISLFQWPFRRLKSDDPAGMVQQLQRLVVDQAWAGSFEALLHRDIGGVNRRLTEACRKFGNGRLVPIGAVNPMLPDWEEDLRRCHEEFAMPGIRIHPNYHGYKLADPKFGRLLELATRCGLLVQLAAAMEDSRTHHPLVQVPDVDLSPLPNLVRETEGARVQILNLRPRVAALKPLVEVEGITFDSARVDDTAGVARLLRGLPVDRVMFGSHAPFLIQEAALIRAIEAGLTADELLHLFSRNAAGLLGKGSR